MNLRILQLRLDLIMFTVTGPSTDTTVVTNILNGNPSDSGGGVDATVSSQCLTDVFSVTSPGGQAPPTICGENSGEHSQYKIINVRFITHCCLR